LFKVKRSFQNQQRDIVFTSRDIFTQTIERDFTIRSANVLYQMPVSQARAAALWRSPSQQLARNRFCEFSFRPKNFLDKKFILKPYVQKCVGLFLD
jgi:hypothetical protein